MTYIDETDLTYSPVPLDYDALPAAIRDDQFEGVEYRLNLEQGSYDPYYAEDVKHAKLPKRFFEPGMRPIDPPIELISAVLGIEDLHKFGRMRLDFLRGYNIPLYAKLAATCTLPLDIGAEESKGCKRALALTEQLMQENKEEVRGETDVVVLARFRYRCLERAIEQVAGELLHEWQEEIA
ncbi:MAG: hypothetical protein IKO51_00775 [Clostridia bacterium]|nr:hypothetical protein [Clostridia bacterium]